MLKKHVACFAAVKQGEGEGRVSSGEGSVIRLPHRFPVYINACNAGYSTSTSSHALHGRKGTYFDRSRYLHVKTDSGRDTLCFPFPHFFLLLLLLALAFYKR